MRDRVAVSMGCALVMLGASGLTALGGDWPFRHKAKPEAPNSMLQVAHSIDAIEDKIRDDGTIVIKQPDVWGQARMTRYRLDFEHAITPKMEYGHDGFRETLQAVVNRSDAASLQSENALAAVLTPIRQEGRRARIVETPESASTTLTNLTTAVNTNLGLTSPTTGAGASTPGIVGLPGRSTTLDDAASRFNTSLRARDDSGAEVAPTRLGIGLEPTIVLDEHKRYLDHLNEIRRVNIGDDTSDSAGYGLYLFRLPVSLQPGEKTVKGHGAQLTLTARPEFGPAFLPDTYRSLVINDVVDQLAPPVYELISREGWEPQYEEFERRYLLASGGRYWRDRLRNNQPARRGEEASFNAFASVANDQGLQSAELRKQEANRGLAKLVTELRLPSMRLPSGRSDRRSYPVAQSDMVNVYLAENLFRIAYAAQKTLQTKTPRAADVRAFMRHELTSAYDLMDGSQATLGPLADVALIEEVVAKIEERKFEGPRGLLPGDIPFAEGEAPRPEGNALIASTDPAMPLSPYQRLAAALPGNVEQKVLGALSWAIAIEAGLLNRELREDIRRHSGRDGVECPADLDSLYFYLPIPHAPTPDMAFASADLAFRQYVAKRWKIVTFALDPVTDQQNIGDSFSRVRDLQLSLAVAFAAGNISFQQFNRFRRQLQYEASTIALNRTVTAFAHGDDTFGWRFAPRFQTPPEERNNLRVAVNTLVRNGPGRNFQANNSKLEAGQRELTAVVIMPSFLQQVRFDVEGSWWRLHDPDEVKPHTAHKLEQGREVIELQHAVATVCDSGQYRRDDLERLMVKVHQLEEMLPFQTRIVQVPYGNALGGFDLFSPGSTALAPELVAFQGVDRIVSDEACELFLFAKNLSLQETRVVVGGRRIRHAVGEAFNDAQEKVELEPEFEILSREILRVTIPQGVQATTLRDSDGRQVVEVYVATPNGLSNRLTIPYQAAGADEAAEPAAPALGYSLKTGSATIALDVTTGADGRQAVTFNAAKSTPRSVDIALAEPTGIVPRQADVAFEFNFGGNLNAGDFTIADVEVNDSGVYAVPLASIAKGLVDQVSAAEFIPDDTPRTGVTAKTISMTAKLDPQGPLKAIRKAADKSLSITFQFYVTGAVGAAQACAEAAGPKPAPEAPPEAPSPFDTPGPGRTPAQPEPPTPNVPPPAPVAPGTATDPAQSLPPLPSAAGRSTASRPINPGRPSVTPILAGAPARGPATRRGR